MTIYSNYTEEKCIFDNGKTKWYINKFLQNKVERNEAENLPSLKNIFCCTVKGDEINDIVLIDNKQNVLAYYLNTKEGVEQMEAFINMVKISQYYDNFQ